MVQEWGILRTSGARARALLGDNTGPIQCVPAPGQQSFDCIVRQCKVGLPACRKRLEYHRSSAGTTASQPPFHLLFRRNLEYCGSDGYTIVTGSYLYLHDGPDVCYTGPTLQLSTPADQTIHYCATYLLTVVIQVSILSFLIYPKLTLPYNLLYFKLILPFTT